VKTRKEIKDLLTEKYVDVLKRYEIELADMEELFRIGKDKPPISKNMPPKAGSIAWSRSIMGRIKAPIKKFKTKADQLMIQKFKDVAFKYVHLAKELDKNHEEIIYNTWTRENTGEAIELLQEHILTKTGDGDSVDYKVNFAPQLKVIIREAKFLDRIGKNIP